MNIEELLPLLDEETNKEITNAIAAKIKKTIEDYDEEDLREEVKAQFKSVLSWVFAEADIGVNDIGEYITAVILNLLKKVVEE